MPLTDEMIQILRDRYSWPKECPTFPSAEWDLDGGGRDLIINRIAKNRRFLVLEIGSFLGSSLKKWLSVSPNVFVIAIDPWKGDWWADYARNHGREELSHQFSQEEGPYLTFISSLWDYRNRIFPVQGRSPDKLYELAELAIQPDLIYFDSDKSGADIEVAYQLFPDAILTGDDWTWGIETGYPIRKAVKAFINKHNEYRIICDRATWVLTKGPIVWKEKINMIVGLAGDLRRMIKRKKNEPIWQ